MKTLKIIVSTATVLALHSPFAIAPAMATITPSSTTTTTMANTCAALLPPNSVLVNPDGSKVYSTFTTEVVETGQVDGPTTEVPGTRVETPGTRIGTGTFTFSGLTIKGDPYRVGGSVNMFGLQGAQFKNWSNSEYDFTADFSTTTTISYECQVTEQVMNYYPAVEGRPVQGYYINCDFGHGQGNDNSGTCDEVGQPQGACAAYNNQAAGGHYPEFWGEDKEQCKFIKTGDAIEPQPERWEAGPDVEHPELTTSHTIDETNVASGNGHEANAGPWTQLPPPGTLWNAGQVVICISPSKTVKGGVPGAWANHNGYTGTKCTTSWFNVAPWGAGTDSSNGTYISVPAV